MTDFDIDFDGVAKIRAELKKLRQKWEDKPVYAVGTNVEYAVFP
jgi:hypothetical protein